MLVAPPKRRSNEGRLSISMREFFSYLLALVTSLTFPSEGGPFTWSRGSPFYLVLNRFLLSSDGEDHLQRVHQCILPEITSWHFPLIFLQIREVSLSKKENMGREKT